MSITHIEDDPLDQHPDTVTIADPKHDPDAGDEGGGVDNDESDYYGRARRHIDPFGTALLRLGVGRSRELDQHPGYEGLMAGHTDPDAPFRAGPLTTGTDTRPERWTHDQALQVRQLLATDATNDQWSLVAAAAPVQIVPRRPERMGIIFQNVGGFELWIGTTQSKARPGMGGFLMPPASVVNVTASCEWWASAGPDDDAIIAWLDQFRTDNGAE